MKSAHENIAEYNQLHKECEAIYHAAAVRLGLSDCAFWILYMLHENKEQCKQSDLSDCAFMPPQTINSALKKIEKDGLIKLKRTPGKTGKSIHLTESGEHFVNENILPIIAAEEKACASFSEREIETFLDLFRSLVRRLEEEIGRGCGHFSKFQMIITCSGRALHRLHFKESEVGVGWHICGRRHSTALIYPCLICPVR